MIETLHFTTRLGSLRLVAQDERLTFCGFIDQSPRPGLPPGAVERPDSPTLAAARLQLTEWLDGRRKLFDLPLDLSAGTPFQQAVWLAIAAIPFGRTTTYRALAEGLGAPQAVRAVGAATGRNPIGLIVPCHRVLGTDGRLTGYAGGLDRKAALLRLEGHGDRQLSLV